MLAAAVGFELQLHDLPEDGLLQQATAIWPLPAAVEAFQWYSDWKETAPSDLDSGFELVTTPMGQAAVATFTNWDPANSSDVNEAMEVGRANALEHVSYGGCRCCQKTCIAWHCCIDNASVCMS